MHLQATLPNCIDNKIAKLREKKKEKLHNLTPTSKLHASCFNLRLCKQFGNQKTVSGSERVVGLKCTIVPEIIHLSWQLSTTTN